MVTVRENLDNALMPAPGTSYPAPQPGPGAIHPTPAPPYAYRSSLLQLAAKHQRTLLACLAVALLLGLLAQLLLPKSYESTAEIRVIKRDSGGATSSLSGPAGLPSTYAKLLKTTPVLKAALASEGVRDLPLIVGFGDRAIENVEESLRSSWSDEIVTVTYRSPSPEDSATVLHAVVDAYLAQLRAEGGMPPAPSVESAAAPRPGLMHEQMVAARLTELAALQGKADAEARQAAMRLTQADVVGDNAMELAALVDASGGDGQGLGAAELSYLNTELKKLDQQLESMPGAWGPEHTIRGPVQRRADAMRYEIGVRNTEVADLMRATLERSHAAAERRAGVLADEIESTQAEAAQVATLPVKVIQWPKVPRDQAAPSTAQTLGIAALGGLGLGLVLAFRRELNEQPSEGHAYVPPAAAPAYALGDGATSPVEGATASPMTARALLAADAMEAATAGQGTPLLGQMPEVRRAPGVGLSAPGDAGLDDPASSIHQIRAVLQVQATATGTRAFAFTSPHRGAGKTSVALGVASSLALSGTRTLVVDCDLAGRIARNRDAEAGFGADAAAVTDVLMNDGSNSADLAHARADHDDDGHNATPHGITGMIDGKPLAQCVVASTTDGLSLLPAVNPQTSHISKLSDAFIRRVIDASREDYDMVIFDTGPVPGSVEALLVASQCDGVVVVVKQGEDRKALERTMSYLKVVGAKVTGTVFNRVGDEADAPSEPIVPAKTKSPGGPILGSGILAAAVFSDAESELEDEDFEPKGIGEDVVPKQARKDVQPKKTREAFEPNSPRVDVASVEPKPGPVAVEPEEISDDFELEETSAFKSELADVFGTMDGPDADGDGGADKA